MYPQLRASGLLATLNTDDPALSDLDLGFEYRSVAAAFGWGWDDMVSIALDGVEACWLDDTARRRSASACKTRGSNWHRSPTARTHRLGSGSSLPHTPDRPVRLFLDTHCRLARKSTKMRRWMLPSH